jgi:predicted TIM-barrel fold metal-dependent hydrolase
LIKRSYLPPDLLQDAENIKIVGTVTMETEWREDDQAGEMRYMQAVQDKFGLPNACVAHAVLDDPGVEPLLEQYSNMPIVRSVRHKPGQAASPALAKNSPSKLLDPQWRRGYALLSKYDLLFDLQVAWWHMSEAVDLAHTYPDETIVVNHAALPSDRSPEGLAGWTEAVSDLAKCPNVVMKISGIGLPDTPWTVDNNQYIVETLANLFGANRIMFASNFPVDSLCATYNEIFGGFLELTRNWTKADQEAAFIKTAVDIYRLDPALLSAEHAPLRAYSPEMQKALVAK